MNSFKDRQVLVVGGSSGIGLQLSIELQAAGAEVLVWSRHPGEDLKKAGIAHHVVDVSAPLDSDRDPPPLPETLHGLVYCPGTIRLAPIQRLSEDDFLEDFNINVLGAVRVIKACMQPLGRAGREGDASVVLFSTVASHLGMSFHASIAAAKSAVQGLARSLAAELASKMIRVNVVSPSLTDTPLARFLIDTDEKLSRSAQRHPLGRIGSAADITHAVRFLLSPESGWVTGQAIPVDGGMSSVRPL
jgi:NAD(P)-dependent dehydrogenase (short-subunit alcohol dehydrogenase family)